MLSWLGVSSTSVFCIVFFTITISEKHDQLCPVVVELDNGHYEELPENRLRAVCDEEYFLIGREKIRCDNGRWTSRPKCVRAENECPIPPHLDNGRLSGYDGRRVGRTVVYECHEGYFMYGENKRTCTEYRYWSGNPPICHPVIQPPKKIDEMLQHHLNPNATETNPGYSVHGRILSSEIFKVGLEIVFIFDRSSSIDPVDLNSAKMFVKKLIRTFKGNENRENGTRVGVITFGSEAKMEIDLTNNSYDSLNATLKGIDLIQGEGGGTAMQPALSLVFDYGGRLRPKAKKAIFLITDGEPNIGDVEPEEMAEQLKSAMGFEIYCVGVGRDLRTKVARERLIKIASEPSSNHVFFLDNFQSFDQIQHDIQNPLTTTPAPPPPGPEACGYLGSQEEEAVFHSKKQPYPWLAAIYVNRLEEQVRFCAGVLVADQWVLTSAICVQPHGHQENKDSLISVVLGASNLISSGRNFYATARNTSVQDPKTPPELRLMMLKLNTKVPLDERYRPVCLPSVKGFVIYDVLDPAANTSIEGWGSMASHVSENEIDLRASYVSPVPRRIRVRKFNPEQQCSTYLSGKYQYDVKKNNFNVQSMGGKLNCVGTRHEMVKLVQRKPTTCAGNFGSPLVTKISSTGRYTLLGIQTTKYGCSDYQSVFLMVSKYLNWIERVTSEST